MDEASDALFEQAEYFADEGGVLLAERWIKAVDDTTLQIKRFPRLGRPCHFRPALLAGTRRIQVSAFTNHILFYRFLESEELILVLHILHGARDIEAVLEHTFEVN